MQRLRGGIAMRLFLCLIVLMFSAVNSAAQRTSVHAIQITWFGTYTVSQVKLIDDPSAPSGQRREGGTITPPSINSDRIARGDGLYFGFGYNLLGNPSGATVELRYVHIYPEPGVRHQQTGEYVKQYANNINLNINLNINQPNLFAGRVLTSNTLLGVTTIQIWHADRLLAEKSFTIYQP